jgi:hypothetical protein
VVVAIVNMTNDKFELVSGNCVGSMLNLVFEADGDIYKLNDESGTTIFGNIGKVPEDPKWGKGPPIEPKEKKVLKERLQVLAEEPWRQQYINLMLRYHDICSKDKFDLGCAASSSKTVPSTVCARRRSVQVRRQTAKVGCDRGQLLALQLCPVLRGKEAATQRST